MTAADPTPPPVPPASGASPLNGVVQRAKNILLKPNSEWDVIRSEPATLQSLFVPYALVLAAIGPLATLIGQLVFGVPNLLGGPATRPPIGSALSGAVLSYVLSLVSVGVLALLIEFLAPTFGGTKDRIAAFKVAIYSWTAAWLAGIFGLIPMLAILSIVGLYSLYLLYLGLPKLMNAPKEKALPYTAVVVLAAIVLFFIVGAIVSAVAGLGGAAMQGAQGVLGGAYPPFSATTTQQQFPQQQFPQQQFPQQPQQQFPQQPQQQFPQQPQYPQQQGGYPQQAAPGGGGK